MDHFDSHIEEILNLILEHKDLHQHRVTEFFTKKLYNFIPDDWVEVLCKLSLEELNSLPFDLFKQEWPDSLKVFVSKCQKLALKRHINDKVQVEKKLQMHSGLNPKKLHEVENLSKIVSEVCALHNCHNVVDIGAGLGHLIRHLSKQQPMNLLGLEQEVNMVHKFKSLNTDPCVQTKQFKLTETSQPDLQNLINETFGESAVMLTGLHCCGDLSVNAINSFINTPSIHHLILLSCCYHSMKVDEDGGFHNFPLSDQVKRAMERVSGGSSIHLINTCSMRLACQQTRAAWRTQSRQQHRSHALNVSYRALLEQAIHIHKIPYVKHKKKLSNVSFDTTFEDYLQSVVSRSSIEESDARIIQKHYKEYEQYVELIEPFTVLQVMLQPLLEHLLLLDRLAYVRQHGYECSLKNIFDDSLSPRNCALIANKISK